MFVRREELGIAILFAAYVYGNFNFHRMPSIVFRIVMTNGVSVESVDGALLLSAFVFNIIFFFHAREFVETRGRRF